MDICSEIMRQVLNHKFTKVGTPIFWSPNVSCYVQLLFFLFQKCTVTNSFPKIVFKEIYQNWNSNILKHKSSVVHPLFFLFLKCTDTKYFPKLLNSKCSMPQLLLGTIVLKKTIDLRVFKEIYQRRIFFLYPRVLCHSYRSKNVRLITSNRSWVWILIFWIHCRAPGMMFKEENHSP